MKLDIYRINGEAFCYSVESIPKGTLIYVHRENNFNEQESIIVNYLINKEKEQSIIKCLCLNLINKKLEAPIMLSSKTLTDEEKLKKLTTDRVISILGTSYDIKFQTISENPLLKDTDGYHCGYDKTIVINIGDVDAHNTMTRVRFIEKVLRHEIIHAYLHESGLDCQSDWAVNEELVDWIAIQMPKLIGSLNRYC